PVGAAEAQGVPVLKGALPGGRDQPVQPPQQQVAGPGELEGQGGGEEVGGGPRRGGGPAPPPRGARPAAGTSPRRALARTTATSTSTNSRKRVASLQMGPISGGGERGIMGYD